ncbi:MAG: hypothetical protein HWE20_09925 [Gammaproteobacteria bacterium]|nr:hypothetical protein [Gammaproteobacteria bacterium]
MKNDLRKYSLGVAIYAIAVVAPGSPYLPDDAEFATAPVENVWIQSPLDDRPIAFNARKYRGQLRVEGDIVVGQPRSQKTDDMFDAFSVIDLGMLWPDGVVPYTIDPAFSAAQQQLIVDAMAEWQQSTGVEFVVRNTEANYVEIIASTGCWSYVGMVGGAQQLGLDSSCHYTAVLHELGHALGLFHEHTRPDRDEYITMEWQNIPMVYRDQFEVLPDHIGQTIGDYDLESVMHYSVGDVFYPWFTVNAPVPGLVVGETGALSAGDMRAIKTLYGNDLSMVSNTTSIATSQTPQTFSLTLSLDGRRDELASDVVLDIAYHGVLKPMLGGTSASDWLCHDVVLGESMQCIKQSAWQNGTVQQLSLTVTPLDDNGGAKLDLVLSGGADEPTPEDNRLQLVRWIAPSLESIAVLLNDGDVIDPENLAIADFVLSNPSEIDLDLSLTVNGKPEPSAEFVPTESGYRLKLSRIPEAVSCPEHSPCVGTIADLQFVIELVSSEFVPFSTIESFQVDGLHLPTPYWEPRKLTDRQYVVARYWNFEAVQAAVADGSLRIHRVSLQSSQLNRQPINTLVSEQDLYALLADPEITIETADAILVKRYNLDLTQSSHLPQFGFEVSTEAPVIETNESTTETSESTTETPAVTTPSEGDAGGAPTDETTTAVEPVTTTSKPSVSTAAASQSSIPESQWSGGIDAIAIGLLGLAIALRRRLRP